MKSSTLALTRPELACSARNHDRFGQLESDACLSAAAQVIAHGKEFFSVDEWVVTTREKAGDKDGKDAALLDEDDGQYSDAEAGDHSHQVPFPSPFVTMKCAIHSWPHPARGYCLRAGTFLAQRTFRELASEGFV